MRTGARALSASGLVPQPNSFTAAASAQEATVFDTSKVQSTKSRAEVLAEAVGVAHSGEVTRFNDVVVAGDTKTRAQVRAEAREALRLGLLSGGEVTKFATPSQNAQIVAAGLRAVSETAMARAN